MRTTTRPPAAWPFKRNPERYQLFLKVQAAISMRRGQPTPMTKCVDMALTEWLALQTDQSC